MKGAGCWIMVQEVRAHVRVRLSCARGENLKIQPPRGLRGYPKFFSHPNSYFFVTINSVQNFKTEARPLLGEKFVRVGGGGAGV